MLRKISAIARNLAVLLIVLLFSCDDEIDFASNERLLVEGFIDVQEGFNAAAIPVRVEAVLFGGGFFGGEGDMEVIGEGFADSSGRYQITTIAPTDADVLTVTINTRFPDGLTTVGGLPPFSIDGISPFPEEEDNKIIIPDTKLARINPFSIEVVRTSGRVGVLQYALEFCNTTGFRIFSENDEFGDIPEEFSDLPFRLLEDQEMEQITISAFETDTLGFRYRLLVDDLEVENGEMSISIRDNREFVFEF